MICICAYIYIIMTYNVRANGPENGQIQSVCFKTLFNILKPIESRLFESNLSSSSIGSLG